MSLTITRDDQRRRLFVVATGALTPEEWLAFFERQIADGTWTYRLHLEVGQHDLPTSAYLRQVEDHMTNLSIRHGPAGPLAIVRGDDAGYGMGRMFQAFSEGHRVVATFRNTADAAAWLDGKEHPTA